MGRRGRKREKNRGVGERGTNTGHFNEQTVTAGDWGSVPLGPQRDCIEPTFKSSHPTLLCCWLKNTIRGFDSPSFQAAPCTGPTGSWPVNPLRLLPESHRHVHTRTACPQAISVSHQQHMLQPRCGPASFPCHSSHLHLSSLQPFQKSSRHFKPLMLLVMPSLSADDLAS